MSMRCSNHNEIARARMKIDLKISHFFFFFINVLFIKTDSWKTKKKRRGLYYYVTNLICSIIFWRDKFFLINTVLLHTQCLP